MDLAAVYTELGTRLQTISATDLHVYPYPPGSIEPDAAILPFPDDVKFDETYAAGLSKITLPIIVAVPRPVDPNVVERLAPYANPSGAKSVKAVLESGTYTAFSLINVLAPGFDMVKVGGTDYAVAIFNAEIWGSGA